MFLKLIFAVEVDEKVDIGVCANLESAVRLIKGNLI